MSKFLYKQVKSGENSKQKLTLHKEWTVQDESTGSLGINVYHGRYSNGSFQIGDDTDENVALEETTLHSNTRIYYKREIFDSAYHLYYTDPENHTLSGDPQYFKQQTRNLNREIKLLSIPSQIFGDRILEGSFTWSFSDSFEIGDDGQGNLIDKNILSDTSQSVSFVTHSKDDFYIKIDFNDGWKLQKGNLVTDKSFFVTRSIHLEDISNGPYEPKAYNVSFDYNSDLSNHKYNGVSGSSFIKFHGSQSIETGSNSYIEIERSGELNLNRKAWNDDFTVATWIKLPLSQSVTQSFTGAFVTTDTDENYQQRLLKDHNTNVIVTSRKYSKKIPWEICVVNRRSDDKGKIQFKRGIQGSVVTLTSDDALNDGTWKHIAAVRKSGVLALYVNGVLQGSTVDDPVSDINICDRSDNIFIGARKWDTKLRYKYSTPNVSNRPIRYKNYGENYIYPATVDLDLFKILNRGLTEAEVKSLFVHKRDSAIVGNIFYNHGIAVVTDLSGSYDKLTGVDNDFTLKFKNSYPVTVHNYKCVVEDGEFNVTLNPTARLKNDINNPKLQGFATASHFSPYITTIGLYSDNNELLAIGKLANPIKSPKEIDITFNVQFDT